MNVIDLTGQTIGGLYVIERGANREDAGNARWVCKCLNCGNIALRIGTLLRKKHDEFCRSCRTILSNKSRMKPEWKCLYRALMKTAKKKNHDILLTLEDFVEFTTIDKCHYCDIDIVWHSHIHAKGAKTRYNLDRKDNTKGYSKDNCVVCCKDCNMLKSNKISYSTMLKFGKILKEERESQND